MTRDEYIGEIAGYFMEHAKMGPIEADIAARSTMEAYEAEEGVFGSAPDKHRWDAECACEVAAEAMEHWEPVG